MANEEIRRERRFSKKELREIIQRASRLAVEDLESDVDTLSLAEVEHIAEDLGIERDHLYRALFDRDDAPTPAGISRLWGAPFRLTARSSVPADISEEKWTEIIHVLRQITGKRGSTERLGDLREWRYRISDGTMTLHGLDVGVNSRSGQTSITADTQYGGGAVISYLLSTLLGITLAGILVDGGGLSDLPSIVVAGSGGALGAATARVGLEMWASRQKQRLNRIVTAVSGLLSTDTPIETLQSSQLDVEHKGRLNIPDSDEYDISESLADERDRNRAS